MFRLPVAALPRATRFVATTSRNPTWGNTLRSYSQFTQQGKQQFSNNKNLFLRGNIQSKTQSTLVLKRSFKTTQKTFQQTTYTTSASTNLLPLIGAGVGLVGLGALSYYGFTQNETEPEYVTSRLRYTYFYMLSSLGITAASAMAFFRSGMAFRMASANPFLVFGASLAGLFVTQALCYAIPYDNFAAKHLAWGAFCGVLGAAICPVVAVGGTILAQAAAATGAIVGSLSLVAASAPTGTFLGYSGPLSIGLGVLIAASFGTIIFPASGLLSSIVVYGGTALFGFFVLSDTQKIMVRARHEMKYDPINNCIGLVMSTVNIFLNMVTILSNNRRR